jgi:exodeoxyribonuclease VII large subunit
MSSSVPARLELGDGVISVSELNRLARNALESAIPLLWVAGEISNLTYAASGHVYFSLKDEGAQVRCAMWRSRAQTLPFRLVQGMRVEVRALATLYEARGDYQLNVENLRQAGIGALYEAYARLKAKLAAEGLFDAGRKRPLPRFPARVGIITSLQAAALRDVLAALKRRAAHLPIVIYPAPVQGAGAEQQLAAALKLAGSRKECDLLILCRGGGSIEDLWAFNDEALARSIAASPIPVVCGIGHESDFTIADYVADHRAATPTAAAERVSADFVDARLHLGKLAPNLHKAMTRHLENLQQRVDLLTRRIISPSERLTRLALTVDHSRARLTAAVGRTLNTARSAVDRGRLRWQSVRPQLGEARRTLRHLQQRQRVAAEVAQQRRRARIDALQEHLATLNPKQVLNRGYSIVRDSAGRIVRDSAQLSTGSTVSLEFAVGSAHALVTHKN